MLTLLTLSVPEKLKNSIFEIWIIPKILNINLGSINLDIIRKLIEHSHRFQDIAVRRYISIMTRTAGYRQEKD